MRALLRDRRAIQAAALSDPLSARIAEGVGFEAGVLLSSSVTMAVLGAPDLSLVTLTEMAEQTRRVTRASALPVLVDGEHGFGNALNVIRTVNEIENAGAAAVTIEDTVLPRAFRQGAGLKLVSRDEGVAKMKAAVGARRSPEFVIVARTSALSVTPLGDTLRRLQSYEAAGVDAVFLSGVKTLQQLQAVRETVAVPILVGAVAADLQSSDQLRAAGVSLWAQGNAPLFDAVRAMRDTYSAILNGTRLAPMQSTAADAYINKLTTGAIYEERLDAYC